MPGDPAAASEPGARPGVCNMASTSLHRPRPPLQAGGQRSSLDIKDGVN